MGGGNYSKQLICPSLKYEMDCMEKRNEYYIGGAL